MHMVSRNYELHDYEIVSRNYQIISRNYVIVKTYYVAHTGFRINKCFLTTHFEKIINSLRHSYTVKYEPQECFW